MARKEKKMPGYMTYREAALMFSLMSESDAAAAIKATVNYFLYGNVTELEGVPAQVFEIMCASIDNGREAYQKQVESGRRGGEKSQQKER